MHRYWSPSVNLYLSPTHPPTSLHLNLIHESHKERVKECTHTLWVREWKWVTSVSSETHFKVHNTTCSCSLTVWYPALKSKKIVLLLWWHCLLQFFLLSNLVTVTPALTVKNTLGIITSLGRHPHKKIHKTIRKQWQSGAQEWWNYGKEITQTGKVV